jgi:ankyrin repeat protein
VDECCRILIRLCHLSSALGQAIFARYHQLYDKKPKALDLHWLEVAASNGSYYAMDSLRTSYPEKYAQLMRSPLNFEPSFNLEGKESSLLDYCRQGDYAGCKMMLNAGALAYPSQEGTVSVLHWLVSFQDENHVNDLVGLILGNGGSLHAWEGEENDFVFGRVVGTPLHWAIWHRNIPLVRALTREDHWPETKHVDRAIFVAAAMHFYDVLEVLKGWIFNLKNSTPSMYDWHAALMVAAESSELYLPRRLRHGDDNLPRVLEYTMDIILSTTRPSTNDVKNITLFARLQNNATLLRYLFNRLDLGNRKDLLTDSNNHLAFQSMAMGFVEIFEICIEKRILTPQTELAEQKWKPLQLCCLARQRDQVFARRLIEIGCLVDGVGEAEEAHWSPFFIAVSLGMYHIAVILLEHGADKDFLSGWLGGSTATMNLLQNWPDIPVSRLKFLLEEVPRLGFGHVAFWSWPGAGGNLLYALSFSHWSSYTAGFRLGQTAKYILSQLANKTCLNIIDKVGGTALRMACASGNLEICQALIEAGQDVNLSMGFSPLKNAKEWMIKCQKREKVANANRGRSGNERRLAKMLRIRAEQTVALLVSNGAIDRGLVESLNNTRDFISSGQWQRPSFEVIRVY